MNYGNGSIPFALSFVSAIPGYKAKNSFSVSNHPQLFKIKDNLIVDINKKLSAFVVKNIIEKSNKF